jgi:murein DD-endopeptidase MepM/ murein hydrolase activator NlpD
MLLATLAWGQETTKQTFSEVANRMVKAINAGDYEGVRKDFNQTVLDAFPVETCRAFFSKEISGKFGKITRLEPPRFKSAAEAVFVARCERGTLDFTLILDGQGRVAGMLFRPGSNQPTPDKNQTKLVLPFNGRWLVLWGGDTAELNQHHDLGAQCFALDLLGVGPDGKTHKGDGSRNEGYYAFGREVLAPADGKVTDVIDGVRDNEPGSMNPLSALGNAVFIQHSKNEVSVLAHFKRGSIKVKVGDSLKKGQVLGLCGNSGNSSEPHIHYHLQNTPVIQDATGIECFFEELVVEKEGGKSMQRRYSPLKADIISPVSNKRSSR